MEIKYQEAHIKNEISFKIPEIKPIKSELCEVVELKVLKNNVNKSKDQMDKFYKGKEAMTQWKRVHGDFDIYRGLKYQVTDKYNGQLVTNAWLKYYEIFIEFSLVTNSTVAFMNAELPGAAICALNHYAKTHDIKYEWWASSFMPDVESVDVQNKIVIETDQTETDQTETGQTETGQTETDQTENDQTVTNRRSQPLRLRSNLTERETSTLEDKYGLFALNRKNWLMDNYNNGDMTSVKNILDYENRLKKTVTLYSHDAGLDVSSDYNKQEELNLKLHLGCALAGFVTLADDGAFIAKQYSYFEPLSWNLNQIYSTFFKEFYFSKPITSRAANSEIYLIGKGYIGMPQKIRDLLFDKLANFSMDAFFGPEHILVESIDFSRHVFIQQIATIDQMIKVVNSNIPYYKDLKKLKNKLWDAWLNNYPLKRISEKNYLLAKINKI